MIGRLTGQLLDENPEGGLVIDVQGVGYECWAPVGTAGRAQRDGERLVLVIHTHVREEAFELFAFASEAERRLFRLLLAAPNVGPRTALGIMSALPVEDLARSIRENDIGRLCKIPGVGKKTAERLVLELKGKVNELSTGASGPGLKDDTSRLVGALTNMGYRPAEAERVVKSLESEASGRPMSELLREALARLTP